METAKPVIAYIRVSTEGQAAEGVSLAAQKARIEAWCLANGHEFAASFVDAGISGGRQDNRPELQLALTEVCRRKGCLVVYSLSRLARSTKDTISIAERLDKAGADLVSLSERIDTTSAAGRMVFRMLAVLAEFERDLISERTCSAMQHKRRRRERVGQVPFGYRLGDDGRHLHDADDEQATLTHIRTLRGCGRTYRAIADQLNRDGVRAKEGGAWHAMAVQRLCQRQEVAYLA